MQGVRNNEVLHPRQWNEVELSSAIKRIKNGKQPGLDLIEGERIKWLIESKSTRNGVVTSGAFPSGWRHYVSQFTVETYCFADGRCLFKQPQSVIYHWNQYDDEILKKCRSVRLSVCNDNKKSLLLLHYKQ